MRSSVVAAFFSVSQTSPKKVVQSRTGDLPVLSEGGGGGESEIGGRKWGIY